MVGARFSDRPVDTQDGARSASDQLQRDWMLPISRGGRYTLSNVVPACRSFPIKAPTILTVGQANLPTPGEEDAAFDIGAFCETSAQVGQSFTAGRTGSLGQVSLPGLAFGEGIDPVASLSVDIYATGADRLPTGPSLGHGTYIGPDSDDDLVNVSLSQPAQLTEGTVYALTWASTTDCVGPAWRFFGGDGDAYPGGQAMSNDGSGWTGDAINDGAPGLDFYFRTWMSS